MILALATIGPFGAKGVYLPPAADARWHLWCIAIAVAGTAVGLDWWLGLGTCVRALALDGFTAAIVGVTIPLDVSSSLMVFWQVGSRSAWLTVAEAQFA